MNDLGMRLNGESKFTSIAMDLGEVVKGTKANAEDALSDLQFIGEFYSPPHDILTKALALAETRVSLEAEDDMKIRRYESLKDVAKLYGLKKASEDYAKRIASIEKRRLYPESQRFPESSEVDIEIYTD
jgi:hypothetical protein